MATDPPVGEGIDQDWLLEYTLALPKRGYAVSQQMAAVKEDQGDTPEECSCSDAAHNPTPANNHRYLPGKTLVEVVDENGQVIRYEWLDEE